MIKKYETQTILAFFWSIFGAGYIVGITFINVPESNHRVVDTALGFVLGTIVATVIGFYFGSSKGSSDKNEILNNSIEKNKVES
jgi:hypothetical protein